MSTLNKISRAELVNLQDWVHDAIEGCDGEFLKIADTIEQLIAGYKDLRDFKLQSQQSDKQLEVTVEVVSDRLYCSECPFKMGYDYWIDLGVAAYVWNTVISSPDEVIACVAHHLKHREPGGIMEDKFWEWCTKYSRSEQGINFFLHISADNDEEVKNALCDVSFNFKSMNDFKQSSYTDKHMWMTAK